MLKHGNVKLFYLPNEAFTFNYNDKLGVELELDFRPRERRNKNEKPVQQPNSFERKEKKDNNNYFLF